MELNVSYHNRPRSMRAEDYLEDTFKRLEPIASRVQQASAELVKEPSGESVVQLVIEAPKHFETVVRARHDSLYGAMNLAFFKLRRNVVDAKDRFVKARKKTKNPISKNFAPNREEGDLQAIGITEKIEILDPFEDLSELNSLKNPVHNDAEEEVEFVDVSFILKYEKLKKKDSCY